MEIASEVVPAAPSIDSGQPVQSDDEFIAAGQRSMIETIGLATWAVMGIELCGERFSWRWG